MSAREPIRVGVLFSQTGLFAGTEAAHLQGVILGVAKINAQGGIDGRPIDPIFRDPASDAERTRKLGTELIVEGKVASIFGCCTSVGRKALLPIVERHNSLLWYPTQFEGFEYSSNVIYGGTCPNQHIVPLAKYLLSQGRRKMFLIGSDYIFPWESNRIMREVVECIGGTIVGEEYVDILAGDADFAKLFARIRDDPPDVIFSTVVGPSIFALFRSYREAGFDTEIMPIASIALSELEVAAGKVEWFQGHITSTPYFESVGGGANSAFRDLLRNRYGKQARANRLIEATYVQLQFFARAVELSGSLETEAVIGALQGIQIAAPQGPLRIDPDNNYTYCWPRIGVADGKGVFEIVYEADAAVRPDPYLVAYQ